MPLAVSTVIVRGSHSQTRNLSMKSPGERTSRLGAGQEREPRREG